MINWTGDPDELLTLDDAAALIPGANENTLKRMFRAGKLTCYRPGKQFLTTRTDVRAAIVASRVPSPAGRQKPKPKPAVPNALGLTSSELANLALEQVLEEGFARHREKRHLEREQRAKARKAARRPPRTER